jgi:hypothetical protein
MTDDRQRRTSMIRKEEAAQVPSLLYENTAFLF